MTERGTILVVEDDTDIRELVAELLVDEGYDVHMAADGEAALDELEHFHPQVMLLDLMLPGVSGFEILDMLQKGQIGHPPSSVVVVSASGSAADNVRGPQVRRLLHKPFKLDQLLETVSEAAHV